MSKKVKEPAVAYQSKKSSQTKNLVTDQSNIERVMDFLGLLGKKPKISNETGFIQLIRDGLPYKVISKLMSKMEISEQEMADILHISSRTMKRRSSTTTLNPEQTERVIELAKLYTRGEEVFGNMNEFREWMDRKVWTLGEKKPKEFLDTSIGIGLLLDELGRIEHGVYS